MTEQAIESGKGDAFLRRIKRSLSKAYHGMRTFVNRLGSEPPIFDIKVFTDNIVVAYPLQSFDVDSGEPELGTILDLFAHVQCSLARDGFLLRGAITGGQHYQDRDIVLGEALLEAVDLDESGKPPRLVIGTSVEPLIARQLSSYFDSKRAPHHIHLLDDPLDGRLFVNYLNAAFEYFPDGPILNEYLTNHGRRVREGLREHKSNANVLEKYKWLASYHNYVCQAFAERYQLGADRIDPYDADPELMAISAGAQHVRDYIIPIKGELGIPTPRRLDAERLRRRLNP